MNLFVKISLGLTILISLSSCAKPFADFALQQERSVVPAKISTVNQSDQADSYLWDFGDGTTSTEVSPSHQYVLSGKYQVKLTVKKGNRKAMKKQEIIFDAPKECLVLINTNMGDMTLQLYDETPKHRDNFLKLASEGFYNDLLFHRVIKGFMVQGGDPNSKGADKSANLGSGGPGYTIEAEFNDEHVHVKGAIAAARTGDNVNPDKRSSGSQFYLVHGDTMNDAYIDQMESRLGRKYSPQQREDYKTLGGTPFLDGNYTVFGRVVEGLDVIDTIANTDTDGRDRPAEDMKILKISVVK